MTLRSTCRTSSGWWETRRQGHAHAQVGALEALVGLGSSGPRGWLFWSL